MNSEEVRETLKPIPYKANFGKPLEFLFHCHQKIAANLIELIQITEELEPVETFEAADLLERMDSVLTYLSSAGVKHTLDEEASLFPRIREHKDSGVDELFEVIGQLEIQHKKTARIEGSLIEMVKNWGTIEVIDENRVDLFRDLAESLYDIYRPHIQIENEFVFPTAGNILSDDELLSIGREIFDRRQVKISPVPDPTD